MMKKMFLTMAAALLSFAMVHGDDASAKNREIEGPKALDVVFVSVNDIQIEESLEGELILEATIEYCNRGNNDIIVAGVKGKALLIDKDVSAEELYSMVYSDFWTEGGKGVEIIPALKKYVCGDYIPEKRGLSKSIKFDKCKVNASTSNYENKTATFKFNIGKLIDNSKTADAAGKVTGFSSDTNKVTNYSTIKRLIEISNTMNNKDRNQAKLIFVVDGIANASKVDANRNASTTIELGKVRMVNVQTRVPVHAIFENRAFANGKISAEN